MVPAPSVGASVSSSLLLVAVVVVLLRHDYSLSVVVSFVFLTFPTVLRSVMRRPPPKVMRSRATAIRPAKKTLALTTWMKMFFTFLTVLFYLLYDGE